MAQTDNFIVAMELGSSKVTAAAGQKQADGAIKVLAYTQEPSDFFIRKGAINNLDKMSLCVANIKNQLEGKLNMSVGRLYVGIGGMGLHTTPNNVMRDFPETIKVTPEVIDSIEEDNKRAETPEREILETIKQEFRLGSQPTTEPIGILANHIEGKFLNILINRTMRQNMAECFREGKMEIVDTPISALVLAPQITTDSERRSGCVFVDMGAETTAVAVFKGSLLRHMAILPLGGFNITNDIMQAFEIERDEAEALKLRYDFAIEDIDDENTETFSLRDGRSFPLNDLKELVGARLEEIISNVNHQIELSKYTAAQLIGGIVLTGGVSRTKNIDAAFRMLTKINKVRTSSTMRLQSRCQRADFNQNGSFNTVLALIEQGNVNCCTGALGQGQDLFEERTPETNPEQAKQEAEAERIRKEKELADKQAAEEAAAAEAAKKQKKENRRLWWNNVGKKIKGFAEKVVGEDE